EGEEGEEGTPHPPCGEGDDEREDEWVGFGQHLAETVVEPGERLLDLVEHDAAVIVEPIDRVLDPIADLQAREVVQVRKISHRTYLWSSGVLGHRENVLVQRGRGWAPATGPCCRSVPPAGRLGGRRREARSS